MFKKYAFKNNPFFYQTLFKLSIPMALTALLGSLLNMADTLMISKIDPDISSVAVTAVGSSNKLFFLMMVSLYGVYSGFGVFISQYWGKKDLKRLQTVYMVAIMTGVIISSIVMICTLIFPEAIIRFFRNDPDVISLGTTYLRIVSFSFIISALVFSMEMVCRSTEKVNLPFAISAIGVITNIILDYLFIFGPLKLEGMDIATSGVTGAAYATVIARSLQLLIYITYIIISKNPVLLLNFKNFIIDFSLFKKIYAKALPVMGNEFFWALGITSIFAAYGRIGTEASASMQLFDTVVALLTVFTMGIANSSAIMIGKKIGEKNIDDAKWYAKLFIFNSVRFGIITSFVLIAAIPFIPFIFYEQGSTVIHNIQYCLLVFAGYMPFNMLAATFIVGILRSGGDTTAAFIFEVVTLWGYAVPMAFLLVEFTHFSIPIIYLIITFELVIKDVFCYIRYKSGKYLHNLVH